MAGSEFVTSAEKRTLVAVSYAASLLALFVALWAAMRLTGSVEGVWSLPLGSLLCLAAAAVSLAAGFALASVPGIVYPPQAVRIASWVLLLVGITAVVVSAAPHIQKEVAVGPQPQPPVNAGAEKVAREKQDLIDEVTRRMNARIEALEGEKRTAEAKEKQLRADFAAKDAKDVAAREDLERQIKAKQAEIEKVTAEIAQAKKLKDVAMTQGPSVPPASTLPTPAPTQPTTPESKPGDLAPPPATGESSDSALAGAVMAIAAAALAAAFPALAPVLMALLPGLDLGTTTKDVAPLIQTTTRWVSGEAGKDLNGEIAKLRKFNGGNPIAQVNNLLSVLNNCTSGSPLFEKLGGRDAIEKLKAELEMQKMCWVNMPEITATLGDLETTLKLIKELPPIIAANDLQKFSEFVKQKPSSLHQATWRTLLRTFLSKAAENKALQVNGDHVQPFNLPSDAAKPFLDVLAEDSNTKVDAT